MLHIVNARPGLGPFQETLQQRPAVQGGDRVPQFPPHVNTSRYAGSVHNRQCGPTARSRPPSRSVRAAVSRPAWSEAARRAVELDDESSLAHHLLSTAYLWRNELDLAIAEGRRAVALNPNVFFSLFNLRKE